MEMEMVVKPAWLEGLMAETFFGVHDNLRKKEKNIFCLPCCPSICPHCIPSHRSHPLLLVRRYVYHDVVRLGNVEKLIDCPYIQVDHLVDRGEDLSTMIDEESDFASSQFEGLRMGDITSNSILEDPNNLQCKGSSCSNQTMGNSEMSVGVGDMEVVRKKIKGSGGGNIVLTNNS